MSNYSMIFARINFYLLQALWRRIKQGYFYARKGLQTFSLRLNAIFLSFIQTETLSPFKSKTYLYKAIKCDPDSQEAVICLVKVCMNLQHFDEALDV
jgi:hypothetical protein